MAKAKVTRIKASESTKKEEESKDPVITRKKVVLKDKKTEKAVKKDKKAAEKSKKDKKFRPFGYFRDSWHELRQVRWPNRKTTWKMVLAVAVYTAIFAIGITLLDILFQLIFNNILG